MRHIVFLIGAFLVFGMLIMQSGCGGNDSTIAIISSPPIVTIEPASITLKAGEHKQFTATVTGAEDTSVTWSADGGEIDQTGFYQAPSVAGTFHITVTSVADPTQSATATVTVDDEVVVKVTPMEAEIEVGTTQQFVAEVTGDNDTSVIWSTDVGTITENGLYTAPAAVGNYVVTATSVADPTKFDSVMVKVVKTDSVKVHVSINPIIAQINLSDAIPDFIQFEANVTGVVDTTVTWTTSEVYKLDECLLTPAGKFIVFKPGVFRIIAVSNADATASAEATVTVTN